MLMEVKLSEFLFRLKVKMISVLQELQISKTEFKGFEELSTENEIVETFLSKIKSKIRSINQSDFDRNLEKDKQKLECQIN